MKAYPASVRSTGVLASKADTLLSAVLRNSLGALNILASGNTTVWRMMGAALVMLDGWTAESRNES